jgi:hypothetical protein
MPKRPEAVSYVNVKITEIDKLEKELSLLKFMIRHVSNEQRRIETEREVALTELKGIRNKTLVAHGIYKKEEPVEEDNERFMFKLTCEDLVYNLDSFNNEPLVCTTPQETPDGDVDHEVETPQQSSDNEPQPPSGFDQALDHLNVEETPSTSYSARPLSSNDNFFSVDNFRQSATYSGELLFNNKPKLNLTVPYFQSSDVEEEDEDDE